MRKINSFIFWVVVIIYFVVAGITLFLIKWDLGSIIAIGIFVVLMIVLGISELRNAKKGKKKLMEYTITDNSISYNYCRGIYHWLGRFNIAYEKSWASLWGNKLSVGQYIPFQSIRSIRYADKEIIVTPKFRIYEFIIIPNNNAKQILQILKQYTQK